MNNVIVGVDTGNSDIKTSGTTTPSGYAVYAKKPEMTSEYLFYNGKYYTPSIQRFTIENDKSKDEKFFILSLIGIAKELVSNINTCSHDDFRRMQEEISKIKAIYLGVGLPPAHMEYLKEPFEQYYITNFKEDGIQFIYNDYEFHLKLNRVFVFPQDHAAIIDNKSKCNIAQDYPSYYGIDIGGGTFDVVPIINGKVDKEHCFSRPLGITPMYEKIVDKIINLKNIPIDAQLIESVLKGEATVLDDDIKSMIESIAAKWIKDALNTCIQAGISIDMRPCIILGGGSILTRRFIEQAGVLKKINYISNPNANAIAYKHLISQIIN